MIFKNFEPSTELKRYVKTYHLRHFEFPKNAKIPAKAFPPRDEQYLNFYIRGFEVVFQKDQQQSIRSKTCLIGQSTQLSHRVVSPNFLLIQVPFYPGALFKLTGIPFYELTDKSVEMELVFPQETREIDEKLGEANSYEEMIRIIDHFLIQLLHKNESIGNSVFDRVFPLLVQAANLKKVDYLADQACLSIRQLERLSNDYFGVSPKTIIRINRFTRSCIFKSRNPNLTWMDVAAASNYEDYQHMSKEFKFFTGYTPNQLWMADEKGPDRVLGLR